MTPLRLIGLDVSVTATGVADASGRCSTIKPKTSGMGSRLDEIMNGLVARLRPLGADVAGVEALHPGGIQGLTMAKLGAARYMACWLLWRDDVLVVDLQQAKVKLYATGAGNATKEAVFDAAFAAAPRGLEPKDFDQADAWWMRQMVMAWYSPFHDDLVEVSAKQEEALRAITWPKLPDHLSSRAAS